jgi:cytochrome P450
LLRDREAWAEVVDDPSLIDNAVEESLRLEPAAARVDRYATADVEIGGASIRRGDLVVVSLAAANRDPAAYERADDFVLRRGDMRTHVAFAHGPHACLGAQLARMQTRAGVRAVADRLLGIRLDDEPTAAGVIFRKPAAVHATWPTVG